MESGNHHDALVPSEMACRAVDAGASKANCGFPRTFALGVLAGAFIAVGACFYTTVVTGIPPALIGPAKLVGGLCFSLGLILVVVGGAELFTGNVLIVMAVLSGRTRLAHLARNWAIVYAGNFVGSLLIAVLAYFAWQWKLGDGAVGATAYSIAARKLSLPFATAFCSGILCNFLVCLAVWLCYAARTVADKVLAIVFPITAFVALGFEHSVANMYFIPYGIMLSHTPGFTASPTLTIPAFLLNNLLPVTIGNIVGGGLLVGAIYWFIYIRTDHPTEPFVLARAESDSLPSTPNSQL
jgi:formate transporter